MHSDNSPRQKPEQTPLDYRTTGPVEKSPVPSAIAGGLLGTVAMLGAVPLAFGLSDQAGLPFPLSVGVLVLALFGLLILSRAGTGRSLLIEQRDRRRRFYVVGFIIGCGIGGLLVGVCFSALKGI